jgi:hypothetical protein
VLENALLPPLNGEFSGDQFLVVRQPVTGQSIRQWYHLWVPAEGREFKPPGRQGRKPGDLYAALIESIEEATAGKPAPDTVTFLFMQGEADTKSDAQYLVYQKSLQGFLEQLRLDLKRPDMNFVLSRVSDAPAFAEGGEAVRSAQAAVAEGDPRGGWVDTDDLNGDKDAPAFPEAAYEQIAERFAWKVAELIRKGDQTAAP